jgi:hypothetical protein
VARKRLVRAAHGGAEGGDGGASSVTKLRPKLKSTEGLASISRAQGNSYEG